MIVMTILTKIRITVIMGKTLTTETKITVTMVSLVTISTIENRIIFIVLVTTNVIMIIGATF